jgi:hypothetical protein
VSSLVERIRSIEIDRIRAGCDRVTLTRADGTAVTWTCPTYGGTIPHDLVHLVVESLFELEMGLWGCLASGLDMEDVHARSATADGGELRTAEALAIVNWYDTDLDGERRCEAVLEACGEQRAESPRLLSAERCERATATLKALKAQCKELAISRASALNACSCDVEVRFRVW